ncbi:MAG TPA: 2-amino-4-hydroxy-6-hydroxymethyldihydropteridine diphosphokinase [Spirochaetota bacterium]|nr:2-amino-4-hydroxy-6-hydroxymethyldihydropteridine diphosphokinase [Spirochaetota bacterium]HOS33704.1 2-amino-4-hydroxy-6-hydroxymethyldihydropteridine diphosphokinase [Spirochaetota bacterium]HOS55204.1 2-amino-4-hydroxy-6-hydroxymethyldihydropteridine diphosphokinase [Spirochaetota bacterium]HPK61436.1 2-amino-4-hydroxy-6-hydroxymethyldihydropteridine diphosphokinase [Spirochaetota bacterium]HQF78557.1 2-amino-4-hydroxy-6-hydroxymethyldihydropteridine diphosphokinase [Spirochaetota bacteri
MKDVFFSLGSNIEPRERYLAAALSELNKNFKFISSSSLYSSSPVDDLAQSDFLNICCWYAVDLDDPFAILNIVKKIEDNIGRQKNPLRPKGPRTIDIDIILIENVNIKTPKLTVPHASYLNRNFVALPLLELIKNVEKYSELKNKLLRVVSENSNQQVNIVGEPIHGFANKSFSENQE